MKNIIYLLLLCGCANYAQFIVNTNYNDSGNHFIYNGNLIFSGNVGGTNPVFTKYDGVTATSVENPSGFTNVYTDYPISYNGEFYFKASPGNFLGKYNGNTVSYIDKVDPADIGLVSPPIIYNGKLNYIYRNSAGLRQLATYDGTTQTIYPNPDAATSAYTSFLSEYNGEAYYGYVNQNGNIALAKFNGSTVTLIPNPTNDSWGIYSGNACVVNNKLIFLFQTADGKVHFANYDGSTITVDPNLSTSDDFIYSNLISFDNSVYARYKDSAGKFHIAKYDGTTMTILPNINTTDVGYMDSPFVYNNKLYFRYRNAASSYWLARTEGNTVELLSFKYLGGYGKPEGYAIQIGSDIYFKTQSNTNFTTLAKFDGTNLTTYGNVGNTDPLLGTNELVFFNNKIHFVTNDGTNDKLSYLDIVLLDNDDFGKNTFKVYPNPTEDFFTISSSELITKIEIVNLLGQTIFSNSINQMEISVDATKFETGTYIVKVSTNEKVQISKVIKK